MPHAFPAGPSPQWPKLASLKAIWECTGDWFHDPYISCFSITWQNTWCEQFQGRMICSGSWFQMVQSMVAWPQGTSGQNITVGRTCGGSRWLTGNRRQGGDGGPSITLKRHNLMAYFLQLDPTSQMFQKPPEQHSLFGNKCPTHKPMGDISCSSHSTPALTCSY